jgi:hypothetical protein
MTPVTGVDSVRRPAITQGMGGGGGEGEWQWLNATYPVVIAIASGLFAWYGAPFGGGVSTKRNVSGHLLCVVCDADSIFN